MPTRDFPDYGMKTDEGDIAVHRMLTCIVTDLRMGNLKRAELLGRINQGLKYVAWQAGHPQVFDVHVQGLIEDEINRACLAAGWPRVDRWDW